MLLKLTHQDRKNLS